MAIDRSILTLIQGNIDGTLTAEEKVQLEEVLQRNDEAREYHRDLQALSRGLENLPRVDPPLSLKPAIMRAIEERSVSQVRTAPSRRWSAIFSFRAALTFAAGAVAGLALFALLDGIRVPGDEATADLRGTLILHGADAKFQPGESTVARFGPSSVSIETRYSADLCLLRLHVNSPKEMSARLEPGSGTIRIEAVRQTGNADATLSIQGNEVVMGPTGSGGFTVLYSGSENTTSTVHLILTSGGMVILDREIALAGKTR